MPRRWRCGPASQVFIGMYVFNYGGTPAFAGAGKALGGRFDLGNGGCKTSGCKAALDATTNDLVSGANDPVKTVDDLFSVVNNPVRATNGLVSVTNDLLTAANDLVIDRNE